MIGVTINSVVTIRVTFYFEFIALLWFDLSWVFVLLFCLVVIVLRLLPFWFVGCLLAGERFGFVMSVVAMYCGYRIVVILLGVVSRINCVDW